MIAEKESTAGEKRLAKIASKHFRILYFQGAQGVLFSMLRKAAK